MRNYCFDIETGPLGSDVLEMIIPPFDESEVKLGLLKNPEKIAERIDKARREHIAKFTRNAALSPLTGEVLAIGFCGPELKLEPTLIIGGPRISERTLLQAFFSFFDESFDQGSAHWIGFNIANFDIPFLIRRAWHHDLSIPSGLRCGRYLNENFTDIAKVWQLSQYPPEHVSLNSLARFFGLAEKTDSGARFAELLRYDPDQATKYLAGDLAITWAIAKRLGLFRREPVRAEPQPAPATNEPIDPVLFY